MLDSAEMPGAPAQDSVEGPVVPAPRAGVVQGSAAPKTCLACGAGLTGAQEKYCSPVCKDRQKRRRHRERVGTLPCRGCGGVVPSVHVRYCSPACRMRAHDAHRRAWETAQRDAWDPSPSMVWAIPASTVGAMHELLVAADLMRRGYEVFRSLSPAASCDLLIRRDDGLTARVEVRTVRRNREGRVGAGARPSEAHRFDVLARVEPSGAIHYTGLGE